jgi:hypothetical protein
MSVERKAHAAAFKAQVALAAHGGIARSTSGPATTASTRRRSRVRVASEQNTGMSPRTPRCQIPGMDIKVIRTCLHSVLTEFCS